jgi:hypothetical protein
MSNPMEETQLFPETAANEPPNTPPLLVRFFNNVEQIGVENGFPKFREIVYFECAVPGSKNGINCQPAKDSDKQRFPKAWARFQDVTQKPREGMPIEQWPQISRSEALNLRAMNIHTVEALASVSEGNVGNLGQGGRDIVARAKSFIEAAKDTAANAKLASENVKLQDQIDYLTGQMNELKAIDGQERH